MYRNSFNTNESDAEEDDLPFDMEPWSDGEDSSESSRPGNPIPKILNEDHLDSTNFLTPETEYTCNNRTPKRNRGDSVDYHVQLTSSGERWQFQKSFLPNLLQKTEGNMFSRSYMVPVTDPTIGLPCHGESNVIQNFRDLEIIENRQSPFRELINQQQNHSSPGDRQSKKCRLTNQIIDENYEVRSHKKRPRQRHTEEIYSTVLVPEWEM